MLADLHIDGGLTIPGSDLQYTAARASGPGGQHVNKTSTKVVLRFDLEGTRALSPQVKERLRRLAAGRLDRDGYLMIVSQQSRYQSRNLADARGRLAALIRAALHPPKRRVATRPSKRVVRRRLANKRRQGEKKRLRRTVQRHD